MASAALLSTLACGGSTPTAVPTPTPTPIPRAVVKLLIDPKPIVATPSGDPNYPWSFAVNVQLSDSGGVAFSVTSMQTVVTAASSGLTATYNDNAFVGVKIPAFGQATRQFQWPSFRMDDNKTKEGTFTVQINFTDDNGFASVAENSVAIQHLGRTVELPQP
jgi:hypothetical protein